jgi:GTP-binding protein
MAGLPADPEEAARLLFARPPVFLKGVVDLAHLPPTGLPEVAIAGRSNVGKSSLINALCGRGDVARTSNTPGRTQELNFFALDGRLVLVDLPGYGFAKAPKAKVDAWTRLVRAFLKGRPSLARVLVLIDSRHGLKPSDLATMDDLAAAAVPFQVVLTKVDLVTSAALLALRESLREALRRRIGALPEPLATSARTGYGIAALRAELAALAAGASAGEGA